MKAKRRIVLPRTLATSASRKTIGSITTSIMIVAVIAATAPPAAALGGAVRYISWEPRVIDTETTGTALVNVDVDSGVTAVEIERRDGRRVVLDRTSPTSFATSFVASDLLSGYRTGSGFIYVGQLFSYADAQRTMEVNLSVPVRDATMPLASVQPLASDAQMTRHIVNIRWDDMSASAETESLNRFFELMHDEFDFMTFVPQAWQVGVSRFYGPVGSDKTQGVGDCPDGSQPSVFGSGGTLKGIIHFPWDTGFDLASHTLSHEIGHRWINCLSHPLLKSSGHWPLSTLYLNGMMGPMPHRFHVQQDEAGRFCIEFQGAPYSFNDLELYLMGLASADEVGDHFVFQDQPWISPGCLLSPAQKVTIQDVIAQEGARSPSVSDSPKHFRVANVVLSKGRLLSPSEMTFFDHMAARGEAATELPVGASLEPETTNPFFVATGGRGTISTKVCASAKVTTTIACNDPPPPTPVLRSLTISKSGTGSGGVTSDPAGIHCGSDCQQAYGDGTMVKLNATPAEGSSFAGWSGACTGTSSCVVPMDQERSVTAMFTTITATQSPSPAPSPTASPEPSPSTEPNQSPSPSPSPEPNQSPTTPPPEETQTTTTVNTAVAIRYNEDTGRFRGGVIADVVECVAGRTLRLFKKRPGTDRLIGSTVSGRHGGWSIQRQASRGAYYARAIRMKVEAAGTQISCLSGVSRVVRRSAG